MIRRMTAIFITSILFISSIGGMTIAHADETINDTNDSVVFKGYEFCSYEPGADDAKLYEEAGALIYEINKISLEDWQNKVFIEKDVVFEKGNQYTIDLSVSSNKDTYFSFFVNPIGRWSPVVSQTLNIGDYDENFSFTTPVIDDDMDMELLFQFGGGGNKAPLKISFSNLSIYKAVGVQETKSNYKVDDFNGLSVTAEGSRDGKLYQEDGRLVFETSEAGKVKIEDLKFKKDCDYEISYTIGADKEAQAAFSLDPKGGYFTQGEQFILRPDEPYKMSHATGIQQADRQMEITFDINKSTTGELVKIVFDEITVKEIKDGQKKNSRNAWVVDGYKLAHEESGNAVAEFDIDENNDIVYKIEKIGANDWNNKVVIDQAITFVKGNAYKVAFSLETDKEMQMFFGVNPKNKWDPKVSEVLQLKRGVNNFSFVTDTQASNENMEFMFQFGGFGNTAPCSIKIKAISIEAASQEAVSQETVAADIGVVKNYDFSPSNDYRFRGFTINDSSDSELYLEQGALVYDIKTFGVNQLIKNDLWLSKNSAYSVEMKVSADRPMNVDYFVSEKQSQKDLTKGAFTIGKDVKVIKAKFQTNDATEEQGRLLLDLSNNNASGKLYIHEVIVKIIEEGTEKTYSMGMAYDETDSKSDASLNCTGRDIEYNVKRFGGNPWENKIHVNNVVDFKKGKTYVVDFEMSSTKDIVFTYILRRNNDEGDDVDSDYVWDRISLSGGPIQQKQPMRYTFKAKEDMRFNQMVFEFGGQGNTNKGPANIFISEMTITECNDYRKDIFQFTGTQGMFSYEHEETQASASLYQENDELVYKIDKLGLLNWHNKIIFNQGIKFEKGYRYRIDVTATANDKTNVKFVIASQKDGKEKAKKYKVLSTASTTISAETGSIQTEDENMEFSLDFGGMYNTDGTTVRISSIEIFKLPPGAPFKDTVIFDDDDIELDFQGSDIYENASYNGYLFNSVLLDSADASLYVRDGILHYDIKEFGRESYSNKVFLNNGVSFNADKNYIIKFSARADEELKVFFAANEIGGGWNPLVAEAVTLTDGSAVTYALDASDGYKSYSFITKAPDSNKVMDIFFEFGGNGNEAPNRAYIKDFSIAEKLDEEPVTFNGFEFSHAEESPAKGILYTNDSDNMVYYADTLGSVDWHNKISTSIAVEDGADYTLTVKVELDKGLDMVTYIPNAKKASTNDDAWFKDWLADDKSNTLRYNITATSDNLEIFFQVGQENYADGRENNRIVFTDFSLTETDPPVDEVTVTIDGVTFSHAEESPAEGILYTNDSGEMVYYAKKLGSSDWHNKVSTSIDVDNGADYTLTVEVALDKGLVMVTDISNAKKIGTSDNAWYDNWLGGGETHTLTFDITADNTNLGINFQVGQVEYADAREDNRIVFKSFSLVPKNPALRSLMNNRALDTEEESDGAIIAPDEETTDKSETGGEKSQPEEQKENETDAAVPIDKKESDDEGTADKSENDEGETKQTNNEKTTEESKTGGDETL